MSHLSQGLTERQSDVLIQFREVTGIEDLSICRDTLQRHRWDIEAAIQAHMNICEGRPSLYAMESRAPTVINDIVAQRVIFPSSSTNGQNSSGFFAFFKNLFQSFFSFACNTFLSVFQFTLRLLGYERRPELIDPLNDVVTFIENFEEKFGMEHPVFYQGTYSQVLNDAKRELRLLYIYLHNENDIDAITFCREVLTKLEVINFFNNHSTLFWACSISTGEGYRVLQTFNVRRYPFIAVILPKNNKMSIIGKISGIVDHQSFITTINQIYQDNEWYLVRARSERVERNLTQTLREQQDQAYIESLRADEEKQRRKELVKANLLAEEIRQQSEAKAEQNRRNNIRELKQQAFQNLPLEPDSTNPDAVHIVFKLPNGTRIHRVFLNSDSLDILHNFVFSHPESPDNFEITTNYPRKVLQCNSDCKSIKEANLKNREVLFVNDLDA